MAAIDLILLLLGLVCLGLLALIVRRHLLQRRGGIDVCLRLANRGRGGGWSLGIGRFHDDYFAWYRLFSLSPGPRARVMREGLTLADRRRPTRAESFLVPAGATIVVLRQSDGKKFQVAMSDAALLGLHSWLESVAPGKEIWDRAL